MPAISWQLTRGLVVEEVDLGDVVRVGEGESQQQVGVVAGAQHLGSAEAEALRPDVLDEPINLVDCGGRVEAVCARKDSAQTGRQLQTRLSERP